MTNNTEQIAELLALTGKTHHAAFIEVDGDDPEWPLWYADYLRERLSLLLDKELTVSELVYLMIDLDQRHRAEDPHTQWHHYYARGLVQRYQEPEIAEPETSQVGKSIPSVTTSQMIEVDRAMIEDFQISLVQMMENAGRNLAHLARRRFLHNDPRGSDVIVLAGTGGNGGGVLVAARRLANYGANVTVVTTRTAESFKGVPRQQLEILYNMKIPVYQEDILESTSMAKRLIIDGLIGYSLRGAPRGSAATIIRWANAQNVPILSLDVPSGVNGTTGAAHDPSIAASATMTLALPKAGLLKDELSSAVGELYLADISVPPALYTGAELELAVGPIFAQDDIVRLR